MPVRPVFFCCFLSCLATTFPAVADYRAEDDFYGDAPVVLTVSRLDKPLAESPASVSVIDRQMIRDSGATSLAEILRLAPGFIVGYYTDNSPVVTYQGLGERWMRRLQVLIDGRSVFIPSYGGIPWNNLPLLVEDIERIEITRGPNAVTYGANAFLATINIITRHSAEDLGHAVSVAGPLDKDSGIGNFYYRYGGNHEDLDWRLSLGHEEDAGYVDEYDSKWVDKLNLRFDYLSAYNHFWSLQLGFSSASVNLGDGAVTNPFRDEITDNAYFNGSWESVDDQVTTRVRLTFTQQNVDDHFLASPLNQTLASLIDDPIVSSILLGLDPISLMIDLDRSSLRSEIELYQNRQLSSALQVNYGLSLRHDRVQSYYLFSDYQDHEQILRRLFGSLEWRTENNWLMDAGLMFEDSSKSNTETSGRLSLIKLMPQHSLRLVVSRANRNPIQWEIEGNSQYPIELPAPINQSYSYVIFRSNPDIQAETILSREIGLNSRWLDNRLTTDLKLFSYRIDDQIINREITLNPDPITGYPQTFDHPENIGTTRAKGLELSFNYSVEGSQMRWFGGYSLVSADSNDQNSEDTYPSRTSFLGGHFNLNERHQLSGVWYHADRFSWGNRSSFIDPYDKLDLRWSYLIDPDHALRFELIGKNLYENYSDYLQRLKHQTVWVARLSGEF